MHLENNRLATSAPARCAGLAATPTKPTPAPPDLDEETWRPDVLEPEMLTTLKLEPPPQPAMRAATASTTRAARAREPPRRRWRALTVSAARMLDRFFASTFCTWYRGRRNLVTATPSNPQSPLKLRDSHAGRHTTAGVGLGDLAFVSALRLS